MFTFYLYTGTFKEPSMYISYTVAYSSYTEKGLILGEEICLFYHQLFMQLYTVYISQALSYSPRTNMQKIPECSLYEILANGIFFFLYEYQYPLPAQCLTLSRFLQPPPLLYMVGINAPGKESISLVQMSRELKALQIFPRSKLHTDPSRAELAI